MRLTSTSLIVGSVILSFTLLAVFGACLGGFVWMRDRKPEPTVSEDGKPDPRKVKMTREEFRGRVMGKTPPELVEIAGRPDETSDSAAPVTDPAYSSLWRYSDLQVYDQVSGKRETWVHVRFYRGRVTEVYY